MTVNRKVYRLKRYTRKRRGLFLRRLLVFAGIAAAVVVVVLFATGVLGLPGKDAPAQGTFEAISTPSPTPSATPLPSPSASPAATASPEASPSEERILKLTDPHMQGDDVKALQEKLGIAADGSFGPSTEEALKAFQDENGLTPDGIAGAETLEKLGL